MKRRLLLLSGAFILALALLHNSERLITFFRFSAKVEQPSTKLAEVENNLALKLRNRSAAPAVLYSQSAPRDLTGLRVGADLRGAGTIDIRLAPLRELDFLKLEEILELRVQAVMKFRDLAPSAYRPSAAVFGQIESGRPWWGIEGIYFFGTGEKSILGPAEESRMLLNPYLLVALTEPAAHSTNLRASGSLPYYPEPRHLWMEPGKSSGGVQYNLSGYLEYLRKIKQLKEAGSITLNLVAYNARDFNYNFLYLSPQESVGIQSHNQNEAAVPIQQYLHKGDSCDYPGGCNNGSPYQPELVLTVRRFPAKALVKLWKHAPGSLASPADLVFTIQIADSADRALVSQGRISPGLERF